MRKVQKETQFLPYAALRGFETLVNESFAVSAKETTYHTQDIEKAIENDVPVPDETEKDKPVRPLCDSETDFP